MRLATCVAVAATSLTLGISAAAVSAQEMLNFATTAPAQAHTNRIFWPQWVEKVNAASNGTIDVQIRPAGPIANSRNVHDRVLSDVVQIGWMVLSQSAGAFNSSSVAELPFLIPNAEAGSVAMWNLYENGVIAGDFEGLKPLALITFAQQSLHGNEPIESLEDIQGMRIAANGRYVSQMATLLGASPSSVHLPGMYQAISKGNIDGAMMVWSAFAPFKLFEVTSHHYDAPLGSAVGMVYMTQERFDKLPPEAQAAIDAHSGEVLSRQFGQFWDKVTLEARTAVSGMPGHTINAASDADLAKWQAAADEVRASWLEETPNGDAILTALEAELADFQAMN
ncbi:MAG: TRAP transporter substrate-binding protein [Pseudomonadota bacterium]